MQNHPASVSGGAGFRPSRHQQSAEEECQQNRDLTSKRSGKLHRFSADKTGEQRFSAFVKCCLIFVLCTYVLLPSGNLQLGPRKLRKVKAQHKAAVVRVSSQRKRSALETVKPPPHLSFSLDAGLNPLCEGERATKPLHLLLSPQGISLSSAVLCLERAFHSPGIAAERTPHPCTCHAASISRDSSALG